VTVSPLTLEDFDYDLPRDLIAQSPAAERDASRLLVLNRLSGRLEDTRFDQLPAYLRPGDLLVANESRVLPARVYGQLTSGGSVELLLVRRVEGVSGLGASPADAGEVWEVMAKPARKLRPGVSLACSDGMEAVVVGPGQEGRRLVRFRTPAGVDGWLHMSGALPLPPYIKRYPDDPERYQTVYARVEGSIAAPTAGLHFTPRLLERLRAAQIEICWVTLHVGPGTFQTVHDPDISRINLEPERATMPAITAERIVAAKGDGRRVIAVGTTTTRLLEGLFVKEGEIRPWSGEVNILISPPFDFKVVDALITNFHLPRSTLLLLVSAFAGVENIRRSYSHAIAEQYRFYSFGDAMLIA
jgi:S-adenosylmethionine:tRNA ribosyltransferase-isomerase